MKLRTILHVDMDAFFTSVEELDDPKLKMLPLAVAGRSKRGILTTCNYIARTYGLHSAMPIFQAQKLCPELVLRPMRRSRYEEKSREVFSILRSYTRTIERMSIDEAVLDVSKRPEDPLFLAHAIQEEIMEKTGLPASIGISYNRFLAKLASDWKKPMGIFHIKPEDMPEILFDLPVSRVYGVGSVNQKKLSAFGLHTVADLFLLDEKELHRLLGKQGTQIYHFIRGNDAREVTTERSRKSIGVERTFETDVPDYTGLHDLVSNFSSLLSEELANHHIKALTIHIKVKTSSFATYTRSRTKETSVKEAKDIAQIAHELIPSLPKGPFRLFGISASGLVSDDFEQLRFF